MGDDAIARALPLLQPAARAGAGGSSASAHGYLDLLGDDDEPVGMAPGPAGRLMVTRALPVVYERWWRPAWGRVLRGAMAGGMRDEHRIARLLLGLTPGDGVLDVACGPGNFTREFAAIVGPGGLAIGIDASATMLARAVQDTGTGPEAEQIGYVRGDAVALPFRDASFDAVCCFAALHLFADPDAALDHMTRVLTPGGRLAILTSCRLRSVPGRTVNDLAGTRSGMRIFGPDDIVDGLRERGYAEISQRIAGLTQFVGGRLGAS
ncbi:tRNA methyltransferase [Baekduia alba]|uniref:methyltransferase domain-containing protein n=1 Tax=Baekduia alba TaxID=2997333 RepID=UPI002340CD08|nr:methyltransferase domain-containing protein [Baekduia alba]WCB95755.1 tRNA methyltransferase [Baekduia alba]